MATSTPLPPADQPKKNGHLVRSLDGLANAGRSSGHLTLNDVASLAKVSPMTVSRVLNRPELVSPDTVERVQRVIDQIHFVPNLLAGGLASRRTKLIAAIVPSVTITPFAQSTQCLIDGFQAAGYQMMLGLSGYSSEGEEKLIKTIISRRPDGICLTGINHSAASRRLLLAAKIPVVETWGLTPTPIDTVVGFSHQKAGQEVAEYLLRRGCRRFALISADEERSLLRRNGFLATLAKHGRTKVTDHLVSPPSTFGLGRDGLARALAEDTKLDAVFCSSDALAHGVMTEAQARGILVPDDLAVIGFGDLDFAAHTEPSLSTVRVDRQAIARHAVEAILARLDGRDDGERVIDIGFQLIERDSTKAPAR